MANDKFWGTMKEYCNSVLNSLPLESHQWVNENVHLVNFKSSFNHVDNCCETYGYDIFRFGSMHPQQLRYMMECTIRLQLSVEYETLKENSPYVSLTKDATSMLARDCEEVRKRDESYGSSWKKRGGVGAFMMLARKYDRIDTNTPNHSLHEFRNHTGDEGVTDTIANDLKDFRRYLLLIETEIRM